MKKSMIYKQYGIAYKGGKILSPLGWIPELLKKGNAKVGANVWTWSMNQTTCATVCKGCYGLTGFYRTRTVKESLARNTEIAREHMDFFNRAIRAQLETLSEGTEIRIHAVGDFFNTEYVVTWHDIVRDFPSLIFWTYTKRGEYESAFDDLQNGNIVKSMVNGEYNFGHCDHVMSMYDALKEDGESVYICKCGIDDGQHCEGCHKCSIAKYVLFLEHSTDYNAKDDPLYETLAGIVNNQ